MAGSQDLENRSPAARDVVRSFSFELESRMTDDAPPDPLSSALIDHRKREDEKEQEQSEWRKYYEPRPIPDDETKIKALDVERNELLKAWEQLRQKLPADQQDTLVKRPQNVNDVILAVTKFEEAWQQKKAKGKFGHFKTYFRKFCSALGSHSTMLDLLPASSQYASVFCGTLQTLIKASMNYDKIAEGLSRALEEITEAVDACVKEANLYSTTAMQQNIANLYAHIFFFLRHTIDWYLKKSFRRTLSSLNENFYDDFQDQISNITRFSDIIRREAQLGSGAEIRTVRLNQDQIKETTVVGLQDVKREIAIARYDQERHARLMAKEDETRHMLYLEKLAKLEAIAEPLIVFLKEGASAFSSGHIAQSQKSEESARLGRRLRLMAANDLTHNSGREEVQLYSRHLEDSFPHDQIYHYYDRTDGQVLVDLQAVSALQEWTTDATSQILCLVGSEQFSEPAPTAMIASQYVQLARQSKIPVVSFFCTLPRLKYVSDDQTSEVAALISLTYALIRQLIELLPLSMTTISDSLNEQRFALLDGSYGSLGIAFQILGDLLDRSPPMLLCVIDGFQQLDDRSTKQQLLRFLDTLRGHRQMKDTEGVTSDRLLKILFTTAGRSRCLLDGLSTEELLFTEHYHPSRRTGRVSGGERSLSPDLFDEFGRETGNERD